jgi:hypothetical protein
MDFNYSSKSSTASVLWFTFIRIFGFPLLQFKVAIMKLYNYSAEKVLIGKYRRGALLANAIEPEATPPNEDFAPASSIKFRPIMLFLLVLTTACNSVQTGQQPSSASVPSPSSATVYFYRLQNASGAAVGIDIKDNGIDLGTLQDGTYFVYHAPPGQHALTATTDTASTQNVKLQAGATYYMKASVVSSQHLFHPSLSVVFDLQGQTAIQNLKRLDYHE